MSRNKRAGSKLRRTVKKAKGEYAAWPQELRDSVRLQGIGNNLAPAGKKE